MTRSLEPNSTVLVGPSHTEATVMFADDEGVHVLVEDEGMRVVARDHVSTVCAEDDLPGEGERVLVDLGDGWVPGTVLGAHINNLRVDTESGEQWVPPRCVARPIEASAPSRVTADDTGAAPEPELDRRLRTRRFAWRHGHWVWLGLGALAPVFLLADSPDASRYALGWLLVHGILAAGVAGQHHPLPRFHPPGFGQPDDPGTIPKSRLERAPLRSKWEVAACALALWFMFGLGALLPDSPTLAILAASGVAGLGFAALTYAYDRHSATEARRLLSSAPLLDAAKITEGCLVGTAAGERGDAPLRWREVLIYDWSTTRQVNKTITDSDGNTRSVVANETTHYRCGIRSEGGTRRLTLETRLGTIAVPLERATWASPRDVWFGDFQRSRGKAWSRRYGGEGEYNTSGGAVERIDVGDRVAVVGKLRREAGEMVGGAEGPVLVFAAGQADPCAMLRRLLLRRRALIAAPALLGLASVVLGLL